MTGCTPGPWMATKDAANTRADIGPTSDLTASPIMTVWLGSQSAEANLAIALAAPDMAEALRLCIDVIENGADDLGAKNAAIAALKKAGVE